MASVSIRVMPSAIRHTRNTNFRMSSPAAMRFSARSSVRYLRGGGRCEFHLAFGQRRLQGACAPIVMLAMVLLLILLVCLRWLERLFTRHTLGSGCGVELQLLETRAAGGTPCLLKPFENRNERSCVCIRELSGEVSFAARAATCASWSMQRRLQ